MRKEFPSIPPVLKSSEALRMLILDLDDSISLAVMAAEHLRLSTKWARISSAATASSSPSTS